MSVPSEVSVRRFVERVRRRSLAGDIAAGGMALVCGACGATLGWVLASAGAGALASLLFVASCGLAFLGGRRLARALARPPTLSGVAAWIESAMPELRDTLATAVESGPLARVSAEYAAPRIADVRAGALLPQRERRERAGIVAGALGVLLAASVMALAVKAPDGQKPVTVRSPRAIGSSNAPGTAGGAGPVGLRDAAAEDAALPARRLILRAVAAPRDPRGGDGRVGEADILVASPRGFERAVELFVIREDAGAHEGDDREGEEAPGP